jgi:hypothetical protein
LSLAISILALVVALSGTAYAALANGSVRTRHLAANAVTSPKIAPEAVTETDLRDDAVRGSKVLDGSLSLHDLGGAVTAQTTTTGSSIPIAAGDCHMLSLRTHNPAPAGYLGSMVVGTITNASGGAVVNNLGAVVPTLLTETSQGGVVIHLGVCAGSSAQTIPAGSVITWSLIRP